VWNLHAVWASFLQHQPISLKPKLAAKTNEKVVPSTWASPVALNAAVDVSASTSRKTLRHAIKSAPQKKKVT